MPPSPCMLAAWARHDERDGGQGALLGSTRLTSTATPCMHPPPSRGGGAGRPASCCWWTRGGAREDRRPSRVVVVPCLPRNQRPGSVLQGEKHASTTLSDFSACQDWWPGCSLDAGHSALLARPSIRINSGHRFCCWSLWTCQILL